MTFRVPKVLLATTCRWASAARLAVAFRRYGCVVSMICPRAHPIKLTSVKTPTFPYHGLAPFRSFHTALEAAQPDLVVPCDDLAREHLNAIYLLELRNERSTRLRALLERSLGNPSGYEVALSRSALIALAREQGVAAPETDVVASMEELRSWIAQFGLPTVLKVSGTSGGIGVKIARSREEAEYFFKRLQAPPRTDRVIKRALVDHDTTLLVPWLRRKSHVVNAQRFLPFPDATIAVASWRGRILASISVEVLRTTRLGGPSSLVRLIENSNMLEAARKLTSCLSLSGLNGFDFLLDASTGKAWLIEMNARATQTCYLPLGTGHNLPAALAAELSERPMFETASITDRDTIALFPQEWQNDPASEYLNSAYHDVPWEEPRLVQAAVNSRIRNGPWLTYDNLQKLLSRLPWLHS
jgi:hypothetical protein